MSRPRLLLCALAVALAVALAGGAGTASAQPTRTHVVAKPTHTLRPRTRQRKRSTKAREQRAYKKLNGHLVRKYPSLERVLRDPRKFTRDMRARFAKQKRTSPKNPYGFDYSEIGMPLVKQMKRDLGNKMQEVRANAAALRKSMGRKTGRRGTRLKRAWSKLSGKDKRLREYEVAIEYYEALQAEVGQTLASGKISYKQLLELSYFFSRAIGHFDARKLSVKDRMMLSVDRVLQGYKQLKIQREFDLYKNREFKVFQKGSPAKGFRLANKRFESAFGNNKELETIMVPVNMELSADIFVRLLSHQIYIVGVTATPIAADGFKRPGGDFWMHDIRHSSVIFSRKKVYEQTHKLSAKAARKLQDRMDLWKVQFDKALATIKDPSLKNAVIMLTFNKHHERGILMTPSNYLEKSPDGIPYLLYGAFHLGNQSQFANFKNPVRTMKAAHKWLQAFWLPKLPQEEAITGAKFSM